MASVLYARVLFSIAALFNFAVALTALLMAPDFPAVAQLDPLNGTDVVFLDVAAVMIAVFGYSYACIAYDPRRYRVYVSLGIVGKLLVVGTIVLLWLSGTLSYRLPILAAGDLIFVALFIDYLRRTERFTW